MRLPKDRKNDYSREAIDNRIRFLSSLNGFRANHLHNSSIDPALTRGNIENIIGFTQVPVGAIGPLRVNGTYAKNEYFVPLSTTEGALIASFNRGARVITLSGGANVAVVRDSIQRAPFFEFENLEKAREFTGWLDTNFNSIKQIAESTTSHGKLLNYQTFIQGRIVFLRLNYSTGDAMGMNMITKATNEVCSYIISNFPVIHFSIESNMAVDKKPAYLNTILGRGKSVTAEVLIKKHLISKFLNTTAEDIDKAYRKIIIGSMMAGTMGSNGHLVNGIAALFLACGQDIANIIESSIGFSYTEVVGGDLYVSLSLPSLVVGTVGGGVSLPTQRECLEMIGCYGTGKSKKFAEIVAVTALAGEISLAASIVAGDFTTAHEKYGRNRPE
jgi:hydroxymethylglutaryl-CoA reductase (NADPH)